jgi:hypothetical protein
VTIEHDSDREPGVTSTHVMNIKVCRSTRML